MADHSALRENVWNALQALPDPVTRTAVEDCVRPLLPPKEYAEFSQWLEKNEGYLLGRLNG